ncbi:MAG: 1,4-dihydroxy-2-naphthoate octaprenyltransferase [Crocinitomicaceae bacterium]|nr:1,4-dihydroxy-2-naphthoate octaprenyltransferase [Crocinitomicaceae bacterium]
MTRKQAWIEAIRPRTLPLSLSGIIFGSAIAFQQGFIDWYIFSFAILTTLSFQILSNLANDYGDGVKGTDNHERVGPTRAVQSGVISQLEMKKAVILASITSFIFACILIYFGSQDMPFTTTLYYIGLAILCIIAAITYTVGKKAYGYNGLGDLMVFIFFGLVSVLGVYPLYTKLFDWNNVLPAISIGLLSTAVLNLNNMRDYYSDKNAEKNTLVVKIGINNAKLYHILIIVSALVVLFIYLMKFNQAIMFIAFLPSISLLLHIYKVAKITYTKNFDPELKTVALSTFAISVLFFISIWF